MTQHLDLPQPPNNHEITKRTETEYDGIKIVVIQTDVHGYEQAKNIMKQEMRRLGILSNPNNYLIRQVRATMLNELLLNGCERNETSYRDPVLENDFNFKAQDYTYAHQFENESRFIENASHMIEGSGRTVTVFYKLDAMEAHHEEKYDYASSLGLGATKVTYSFKDTEHKSKAIYAVIVFKGKFEID